jgi:hypothetical protein
VGGRMAGLGVGLEPPKPRVRLLAYAAGISRLRLNIRLSNYTTTRTELQ